MNRFRTLAASILLAPCAVLADDAATATPQIPPPDCHKPVMPSGVRRADDTSDFDAKVQKYQACIQNYANTQNAIAKAYIKAANDAIESFNAYIKQVNEQRQERQQ